MRHIILLTTSFAALAATNPEPAVRAVVMKIEISDCKYNKTTHQLDLLMHVKITNESPEQVLLYKGFEGTVSVRIAESEEDLRNGKYTEWDGDEIGYPGKPPMPALSEFASLKPHESIDESLWVPTRRQSKKTTEFLHTCSGNILATNLDRYSARRFSLQRSKRRARIR
jgi:hypothetical protein